MAISRITASGVATDTLTAADIANDAIGTAELANDVVISTSGAITTTGGMTVDGATVFNEASADVDFRVESNGNANMLFVDASTDRVGIGTAAPNEELHIEATNPALRLKGTATDCRCDIYLQGDTKQWNIKNDADNFYVRNDTDGVMAMAIDTSGKVGFGTANCTHDVTIEGDGARLGWRSDYSSGYNFLGGMRVNRSGTDGGNLYIETSGDSDFDTPVARITCLASGNVGIGTTSPDYPLQVEGSAANVKISIKNTNGSGKVWNLTSNNSGGFDIDDEAANMFRISTSGTFTGSASADISDERLKENITSITDALTTINALTGRTFTWKPEANLQTGTIYGIIAQELESVIPELVYDEVGLRSFDKDGNLKEFEAPILETDEYSKSVQMSGLIPVLVEAVKELSAKVTALESA